MRCVEGRWLRLPFVVVIVPASAASAITRVIA